MCGLIELYHYGMAGTDITGKLCRFDSWLDQLRAPEMLTRTSTWLPEAPHPHPTLRRNPTNVGKPLRRLLRRGYYVT
jgi:hypothetical protein